MHVFSHYLLPSRTRTMFSPFCYISAFLCLRPAVWSACTVLVAYIRPLWSCVEWGNGFVR
ncbi:hypothetical protein CALVIDRAFT_379500 [Calocera viscosa TUFC12733]|uniref:Uncharacterized protein n=1 Tax=Calocera viscosa (strain TUFC12733) TaxID=1330018 RepID=A0A167Q3X0_CALVF|nr:hypothetical protein CALVIDRAFT_379500 [Calocera viscosa TUFC12733]